MKIFGKNWAGILVLVCMVLVAGCEGTNVQLAVQAGLDALKAATLTDEQVRVLAVQASRQSDGQHRIAGKNTPYGQRLARLTQGREQFGDMRFDIQVYLSPTVNAFAMADGTIRIYSGLMDMMNDGELLFVVGHEMGHVTMNHIRKKIMMAYAASALRKGIASQENLAGFMAGSALGGFVQALVNAQFSQQEEREADDAGIVFLTKNGVHPSAGVTALEKLATLGKGHSFLSSHPDPDTRAERLRQQAGSPEETPSIIARIWAWILGWIALVWK